MSEVFKRPVVTDKAGRTAHVFIRNNDSGEPAIYCGPISNNAALRSAMGCVLDGELQSALEGDADQNLELEVWWMTPEEVAAIPEI